MKRHWTLLFLGISLVWIGCEGLTTRDYGVMKQVKFENQTNADIEIKLMGDIIDLQTSASSFGDYEWSPLMRKDTVFSLSIKAQESIILYSVGMGSTEKIAPDIIQTEDIGRMIGWDNCLGDSMEIKSNEKKSIRHRHLNKKEIRSPYNGFFYEVVRTGNLEFMLTYTFTQEDYDTATPIE